MEPFDKNELIAAGVKPNQIGILRGKYPVTFSYTDFPPGNLERVATDYFDIYCPTRPAEIYEISGSTKRRIFNYKPGCIAFNPAKSSWHAKWDTRIEGFSIYIQPEILEQAALDLFEESAKDLKWRLVLADYVPSIAYLALDIGSQAIANYPAGYEFVEKQFEILLNLLIRRYSVSPFRDTSLVGIHSAQVIRAVQYISENLENKISVLDITDAAASSPSHLNRLFRAELGLSVWNYVQKQRQKKSLQANHEKTN